MKTTSTLSGGRTPGTIHGRFFSAALAAVGLMTGLSSAQAADNITFPFNDAASATFSRFWGAAVQTYEFDALTDAANDPASGSQKITAVFDLATHGGDNQFAAQFNVNPFNGVDYTNFVFDIRFDPTSPQQGTTYGNLEYGLIPSDFSQIQLGTVAIPAGTAGWTQVQARIDPATPKLESIRGFWFKIWSGGAGGLTGSTVMWIDNITVYANTNVAPPPPPTLAITPANPGIRVFASQAGAQYQRQNIYTRATAGNTWVGAAGPVTYSLTVADYPDSTHNGFQTHLFLVPGTNLPDWESSPDWNEPNLIFLDIGNGADGTGYASLRYKTNLPNGNTMVYNANPESGPVGTIASVGSTTPNGTWSLTFSNNTDVTITSPSGATASATLPAEAAALFAGDLHIYAGIQPNNLNNIGQSLTFKRLQVTGTANPINETFTNPGVLGGETWNIAAADRTGLIHVSADAVFWLSWALPDTGWVLQWTEDLDSNFWNDIGFTTTLNIGGRRQALARTSELPVSFFGNYFFQMILR
jgi:hypothetical protein